jgi:hypothetical protein
MADARQSAEERPLLVLGAVRALGRALVWVAGKAGPLLARTAAASGRGAWRHRDILAAIAVRACCVLALWLLVDGGQRLLQIEDTLDPITLRQIFALGLGLCTLTALLAVHRRLRWAAIALGTAHGALVLLLTTANG